MARACFMTDRRATEKITVKSSYLTQGLATSLIGTLREVKLFFWTSHPSQL
jgi:hypothetical protein